jgi:hypothetical protein
VAPVLLGVATTAAATLLIAMAAKRWGWKIG